MPDKCALEVHYSYWDKFISRWLSDEIKDCEHLPEPWWGWTPMNGKPLYSVVINLNPADGGKLQEQDCIRCFMEKSGRNTYSEIMPALARHLRDTEKWHYKNRYMPLMQSIGMSRFPQEPDAGNHLSIELSPKHGKIDYKWEFTQNAPDIYDHVLCFAAEASKRIEKPDGGREDISLNNIVFIRAASSHIRNIKNRLDESESYKDRILLEECFADPRYMMFRLNEDRYKDTKFVCVTGFKNNLPAPETLTKILKELNK